MHIYDIVERKCFSLLFQLEMACHVSVSSDSRCRGWQRIHQSRFYFNTTSNMFSSNVPEPAAVRAITVSLLDSLISGEGGLPAPAALQLLAHHPLLAGWLAFQPPKAEARGWGKGFCLHSTPHPAGPQTQHSFMAHQLKTQNPGGGLLLLATYLPSPSLKKGKPGEAVQLQSTEVPQGREQMDRAGSSLPETWHTLFL